jgi:hypothetical protein
MRQNKQTDKTYRCSCNCPGKRKGELARLVAIEQIAAIWKASPRAAYDCATNPSTEKGNHLRAIEES